MHDDIPTTGTSTSTSTSNPKTQPPPARKTKHLYFAYGSNLSPTQMAQRCTKNPHSSIPLAIAFLPKWRWLICQAGYANVLPPVDLRVEGAQRGSDADCVPISISAEQGLGTGLGQDGVYGVLYDMDISDEEILDGYEGVDYDSTAVAAGQSGNGGAGVDIRPRDQGDGHYNKWFCKAVVQRWLGASGCERGDFGVDASRLQGEEVNVLVYVDEVRVRVGVPRDEYIPRMNRAIEECVGLGVDEGWIEGVMRRFIPRD